LAANINSGNDNVILHCTIVSKIEIILYLFFTKKR